MRSIRKDDPRTIKNDKGRWHFTKLLLQGMSTYVQSSIFRAFDHLYPIVYDVFTKNQVKPDRKIFYDYYDIIENPISFKEINYKLKRRQYADIAAFESDFALLCSNARTYNAVGSMVYMDSEYLREAFYSKLSVICKKNGLPVIEKPAITEVGENGHIFGENNGTASNSNDLEEEDISPLKLKINFSKQKL